jgi:hypothetical protein
MKEELFNDIKETIEQKSLVIESCDYGMNNFIIKSASSVPGYGFLTKAATKNEN